MVCKLYLNPAFGKGMIGCFLGIIALGILEWYELAVGTRAGSRPFWPLPADCQHGWKGPGACGTGTGRSLTNLFY